MCIFLLNLWWSTTYAASTMHSFCISPRIELLCSSHSRLPIPHSSHYIIIGAHIRTVPLPHTLFYSRACEANAPHICSTCCRCVIHAKSLSHILLVKSSTACILQTSLKLMEMHIFNEFSVLVRRGAKCTPFYVILRCTQIRRARALVFRVNDCHRVASG